MCRGTNCLRRKGYGPIRGFFPASYIRPSEGLFGQSFSVAPPVQALRELPCLGPFSVAQGIRHIEGPPWLGSYSVDRCVRSQVFDGPACLLLLLMLECGKTEAMVMVPPPMCDSAVLSCFHGCQAFLHRHFLPQSPPSQVVNPSLCSQQQPSLWDCSIIPKLQLPAAATCRGPASLSWVCLGLQQGLSDSHSI